MNSSCLGTGSGSEVLMNIAECAKSRIFLRKYDIYLMVVLL